MISFPSPTPTAASEPQLTLQQRSNSDSGSSTEGDKPFDSFLDTNQTGPDPKLKLQLVKPRTQNSATRANSAQSNDPTSGNRGDVRNIRNIKGNKKSTPVDADSTSTSADATTETAQKKEIASSLVEEQASTDLTLNDQIATALMSASQHALPTPEGKGVFTLDLTASPESQVAVKSDLVPVSTEGTGISSKLESAIFPVSGAILDTERLPSTSNIAQQGGVTSRAMGSSIFDSSKNVLASEVRTGLQGSSPSRSVGFQPVSTFGEMKETEPLLTSHIAQSGVGITGTEPLPTSHIAQSGVGIDRAQPLSNDENMQIPPTTVQSVTQLGMNTGKSLDQQGAEAAKNSIKVEGSVVGGERIGDGKAQFSSTPGETMLSTDAGTSIATQHHGMSVSTLHPQTKTSAPNKTGDAGMTAAVDAGAAPSLVGKGSDHFGSGQRNSGGQAEAPVQDLSALQNSQGKEVLSSTNTGSSVSPVLQTNITQHVETVMKQMFDTATRMTSDGRNNVELQVNLKDGTAVSIKLQMVGGQIQPTFKTDSSELRQAIEQNWSEFSSKTASGNSLIANPVFESPKINPQMNDLNQQQGGRQQSSEAWAGETSGFTSGQFSRGNRGQGEPVVPQTPPPLVTKGATYVAPQTTGLDLYA